MIRAFKAILFLLVLALPLALPVFAQEDPVATAQAAQQQANERQWHASQAAAAARVAQATADAAWGQATAQAVAATATARWVATATPAAATAGAQATQQALQTEGTRQAIYAQATQASHEQSIQATVTAQVCQLTATKAAAIAEQDRLFVEMDRMTVARNKMLNPLYIWSPWVLMALFIALTVWAARQLLPLLKDRLRVESWGGGLIEGEMIAIRSNDVSDGPDVTQPSRQSEPQDLSASPKVLTCPPWQTSAPWHCTPVILSCQVRSR